MDTTHPYGAREAALAPTNLAIKGCQHCRKAFVDWDNHRSVKHCSIKCRLMDAIEVDPDTDCWNWQGTRQWSGHGEIHYEGKTSRAHRVSYRAFKGEIPDGMAVCHSCDNPACINPDHLWLGSQAENLADMREKGRGTEGQTHPNAKLTEAAVREIRASKETSHALGRKYGVSHSLIVNVRQRKAWRHVK